MSLLTKVKDGQGWGLAAAVFYCICSASMAFLNKAVISSYEFPFPFFIMACQMLVTIIFLELLDTLGWVNLPAYNWRSARSFLVPSMAYALNACFSLMALQGMNIPMYGAVKRCTPLVNLVLATLILRRPPPSFTLTASILTIIAGCFVAVLGDLTFDGFAYTMGGLSVLVQGLYLTLVQQCAENQLSTLEILKLNSYNTVAPFIVASCLLNEPEAIMQSRYIKDLEFHTLLWMLVCLGAVLNYSLFLCTALNSAITTSLVAVAKSAIQTMIGFFVFGGVRYHPLNIAGIAMNTVGGFMYTYTKYQEGQKKRVFKDENYNKLEDISTREVKDQKCLTEVKVS